MKVNGTCKLSLVFLNVNVNVIKTKALFSKEGVSLDDQYFVPSHPVFILEYWTDEYKCANELQMGNDMCVGLASIRRVIPFWVKVICKRLFAF